MAKITILEDEERQAQLMLQYLHRCESELGEVFTIRRYDRALRLLDEYRCDTDILLLDIQVPDMLGIDLAREIRKQDEKVIIIFVTNLAQYAIEGYSVRAMDYILKPLAYASFSAKLTRALRMLAQQQAEGISLQIKTKTEIRRVPSSNLAFIEVINHTLCYHLTDGTELKQWGSLGAVEEQLTGDHFVRCNSGYLVNLKYVETIEGDTVTVWNTPLKISSPRRKDFLRAVAMYKGGSR